MTEQVETQVKSRSPWVWIPTLYFAEGLPYVVVMTVSVIMYRRFGISNAPIGDRKIISGHITVRLHLQSLCKMGDGFRISMVRGEQQT